MFFIRQNATHKVTLGPAVAVGDGFTPVTGLTLGSADEAEAILHDNGTVVDISAYTFAAITTADGYYHLTLQSGISGTVGHMTVVVNDDSLILPLRQDFTVLEEAAYDAIYAAAAPGYVVDQPVNTTKVGGTTQTARDLGASVLLSSGTGTGQISLSSGAVLLQATQTGVTIPTVTTLTGHTAQTGDSFARLGAPAGASVSADVAAVKADSAAILVDTADIQPKIGTPAADLSADIAAVKVDTAAVLVDTADMQPKLGAPAADISADIAAVKVDTAAVLVDTADMQPKLGTPAADISADIAAVKVDTAATLVDTGTTLPALLPAALVGGRMDADIGAISTSATAADNLEASALGIVSTSVNDASASTTAFVTALTETTDDHYNGRIIVFTSGALAGQATDITDYVGSTKTVTVTALTEAPADSVTFVIV